MDILREREIELTSDHKVSMFHEYITETQRIYLNNFLQKPKENILSIVEAAIRDNVHYILSIVGSRFSRIRKSSQS